MLLILSKGIEVYTIMKRKHRGAVYLEIKDSLERRIKEGEFSPGFKLPSERDLAQEYGVNRATIRRAIETLIDEGLLFRIWGKGTFVVEPKIFYTRSFLLGFTDSMLSQGLRPGAKLIKIEILNANKNLADKMKLSVGEKVYHLIRIRTVNDIPIAIENSYHPFKYCPGLENCDLEGSIYLLLKEKFNIEIFRAEESIEPTIASELEAKILNILPGTPLLLLERVTFTKENLIVEYAKDLYRGDKCKFVSEIFTKDGELNYKNLGRKF